jgi:hypothetical protein
MISFPVARKEKIHPSPLHNASTHLELELLKKSRRCVKCILSKKIDNVLVWQRRVK